MWRQTTEQRRNLEIWQREFEAFVPPRILDFHVHVVNAAALPSGEPLNVAGHDVKQYSFADLQHDLPLVYPGREASAVCFGWPSTRYEMAANNRYVAEHCDGKRFFGLRLLNPADDPVRVREDVARGRFYGFKPYLDYVRKDDLNQVEIREMLPEAIMGMADELGLAVMLHIPRRGRLADPLNQQQVAGLCRAYPNAKIILAHIGRAYFMSNVVGHLEPLTECENLYIDTAMLNHWEVLEHAFRIFPRERILYGTDIPIALAPGKSVEINDQYTYVTPVPWKLSIADDHGKLVFTSFLYEQLRAIQKAVERLGLGADFVEALFYENGMRLLHCIRKGEPVE